MINTFKNLKAYLAVKVEKCAFMCWACCCMPLTAEMDLPSPRKALFPGFLNFRLC